MTVAAERNFRLRLKKMQLPVLTKKQLLLQNFNVCFS